MGVNANDNHPLTNDTYDWEYISTALNACRRVLAVVDDAKRRGVHTQEEWAKLRESLIRDEERIWGIGMDSLRV